MTYRVELLPDRFELDYHQMGDTFKLLADIRFRAAGTRAGRRRRGDGRHGQQRDTSENPSGARPARRCRDPRHLALRATQQRLYNWTVHRAQHLERELGFPRSALGAPQGGVFGERRAAADTAGGAQPAGSRIQTASTRRSGTGRRVADERQTRRSGEARRLASRRRGGRRGGARAGSRWRSSSSAEREGNREKVLALVRERPGITKAELRDAAGLSSAGVAQNLRRMLDRGEVREEALPSATTSYRIVDGSPRRA